MLEFYLFIFNFMATSTAYGSSPARDWICSDPCHTCSNAWSFDPLHQAGDGTCTSAETWAAAVRFLTYWATVETAVSLDFYSGFASGSSQRPEGTRDIRNKLGVPIVAQQ